MPGGTGLRFSESNARHLRVGEYHRRHGRVVIAQAIAVQRVLGSQLRAVGRHVNELVLARDVADGVNARL